MDAERTPYRRRLLTHRSRADANPRQVRGPYSHSIGNEPSNLWIYQLPEAAPQKFTVSVRSASIGVDQANDRQGLASNVVTYCPDVLFRPFLCRHKPHCQAT